MKLFIVYVIQSEEGFRYTGMTEDLGNRLQGHNNKSNLSGLNEIPIGKLSTKKDFQTKLMLL